MTNHISFIIVQIIGEKSSWFWTMMQFVVYVFTFIAIIRQLRTQNRQNSILNEQIKIQNRQIEIQNEQLKGQININIVAILNDLNEQWWSTRMRRARRKACEDRLKTTINVDEEAILSFFENINLFCSNEMIEEKFIWETYSYYIERYWLLFKDNVERFQADDSSYFSGFVKLKNNMEKISKDKGCSIAEISKEQLSAFADSEKLCYTPIQNQNKLILRTKIFRTR